MSMKLATIIAMVLITVSCESPQRAKEYHAVGYVRNVWCKQQICEVTFEHETGEVTVLRFNSNPAIWTGMHCELVYETIEDWDVFKFIRAVRR